MSTINDGGPAFPRTLWTGHVQNSGNRDVSGMSLRDWFAGQATDKDIADYLPATVGDEMAFKRQHGFFPSRAWAKYQYADAMIAERERKEQKQ